MLSTSVLPRTRRAMLPLLLLAGVLALVVGLSVAYANVTFTGIDAKLGSGGVTISWSTATEVKTAGFRVMARTAPDTEPVQVGDFIPAQGDSLFGASYSFTDPNGSPDLRYYVEVVNLDQSTLLVGPLVPLSNDPDTRLFLPLVVRGL